MTYIFIAIMGLIGYKIWQGMNGATATTSRHAIGTFGVAPLLHLISRLFGSEVMNEIWQRPHAHVMGHLRGKIKFGDAEPRDTTAQDRSAIRYRMRGRVRALRSCYQQERQDQPVCAAHGV